ncbi:MAG: hypothetical protein R6V32_02455 [Bacteroidales bacterium]
MVHCIIFIFLQPDGGRYPALWGDGCLPARQSDWNELLSGRTAKADTPQGRFRPQAETSILSGTIVPAAHNNRKNSKSNGMSCTGKCL